MKITRNIVVELDQSEIVQAIMDYIENRTEHRVSEPDDVTLKPAHISGGVTASVVVS